MLLSCCTWQQPQLSSSTTAPFAATCILQDTRSFYEQFQDLKGSTDLSLLDGSYPKPSLAANAKAPTAQKMALSDVVTCKVQRPLLAAGPKTLTPEQAEWQQSYNFFWRTVGFVLVHGIFFSVSHSSQLPASVSPGERGLRLATILYQDLAMTV